MLYDAFSDPWTSFRVYVEVLVANAVFPCYYIAMTEKPEDELDKLVNGGTAPAALRFALNVIGGLIPFAGGAISGASSAWSEQEQQKINSLIQAWLKLQEDEIKEIGQT